MTVRLECYQGCKLENGIIFVSVLSGTRWHLLLHGVDAILISQDEDEYSVVGGGGGGSRRCGVLQLTNVGSVN